MILWEHYTVQSWSNDHIQSGLKALIRGGGDSCWIEPAQKWFYWATDWWSRTKTLWRTTHHHHLASPIFPIFSSYHQIFLISSDYLWGGSSQSDSIWQIDSQAWAIWSDSPKVIALNWGNKSFKRKNINWCFCLCSHFDWVWQILNMRRTGCEAVFLGFSNSSRCEEEEMRR